MSPKSIVFIKLSLICFCNQWSIAYFTEFDIQMKEIVLMKNSPKTTTRTCPWDNWYIVVKKIWTIQFYHMTYHINKISDLVSLSIRKCHKITSVCEDLAIICASIREQCIWIGEVNLDSSILTYYSLQVLDAVGRWERELDVFLIRNWWWSFNRCLP